MNDQNGDLIYDPPKIIPLNSLQQGGSSGTSGGDGGRKDVC